MLRYYEVELKWVAVVEAESEAEARTATLYDCARDICLDMDPDVDVVGEIKGLDGLPDGWHDSCLPYNGDGEQPLSALLIAKAPVRDTKTIDMFEVKP